MSEPESLPVFVVDDSATAREAMMAALYRSDEKIIPIEVQSVDDLAGWLDVITPALVVLDITLGEREDATHALPLLPRGTPVVIKTAGDGPRRRRPFVQPLIDVVVACARAHVGGEVETFVMTSRAGLSELRATVWRLLGL